MRGEVKSIRKAEKLRGRAAGSKWEEHVYEITCGKFTIDVYGPGRAQETPVVGADQDVAVGVGQVELGH